MISRPGRLIFPSSAFFQLKNIRSLQGTNTIPKDEKNERHEEKYFICMSTVTQHVPQQSISKSNNVDFAVGSKRGEDSTSLLISYPATSLKANEQRHGEKKGVLVCNQDQLIKGLFGGRDQILTDTTKTYIRNSQIEGAVRKAPVSYVNLKGNVCLCDSKKNTGINGITRKDLPTQRQLDEIMLYFTLQAPFLFSPTGWTYRKATYNIVFQNMIFNTQTEGLRRYMTQVNILKLIVRGMLKTPELGILQMSKEVSDGRIDVRWHVHGVPRTVLKPLIYFGIWNGYVDGTSIFYVNSSGLYYRHILMQMSVLPGDLKTVVAALWMSRLRVRAQFMKVIKSY